MSSIKVKQIYIYIMIKTVYKYIYICEKKLEGMEHMKIKTVLIGW